MRFPGRLGERITRANGITFDYQFDVLGGIPEAGNSEFLLRIWYGGKEYEVSCQDGWNVFYSAMDPDGRRMICGDDPVPNSDLCFSDLSDTAWCHYAMTISNVDIADDYMALNPAPNGNLWRMHGGDLADE